MGINLDQIELPNGATIKIGSQVIVLSSGQQLLPLLVDGHCLSD
jgi:hypothetical protein